MKIIKNGGYIGTDEGRLYLDGYTVECKCAYCGKELSEKLIRDTYVYDCIQDGKANLMGMYCSECDNHTHVEVEIEFKVSVKEME